MILTAPVVHSHCPSATRLRPMSRLLAGLIVAVLTSACQTDVKSPRAALSSRDVLTVVMHPTQSPQMGETLKRVLKRALPGIEVEIHREVEETAILAALQDGRADVAFDDADVAYGASIGLVAGRQFDRLRGIATLNANPLHVLVRPDSRVRVIDDLSGRRVNVGPAGTAPAPRVQAVLAGLGGNIIRSHEPLEEAVTKLAEGRIDAIVTVGGYSPEHLRQALATGRARMVSLSNSATGRLRRNQPFLRRLVIPRGVYDEEPIRTIGIDRLLMCREGLAREIVYRITQVFFESLSELTVSDPALRQMDVENAPATPVPLHEGAARYYREQEQM